MVFNGEFLLLWSFSVAISVSPHVCFIESPAKQKRDICTAFSVLSSSSAVGVNFGRVFAFRSFSQEL